MEAVGWTKRWIVVIVGLVAAIMAAAGCSGSSSSSDAQTGTITFPDGIKGTPNYIFPFAQQQQAINVVYFQPLMWRPLYYTGDNGDPTVNLAKSLASAPKWSDDNRTATLTLKRYKWSDGTSLTPANVAFWMGLEATEKAKFYGYTPGFFPDNVSSVDYDDNASTVTFHLTTSVSPSWFLNDQLTQITPIPTDWDVTGSGKKGTCSSEDAAAQKASCPAVYAYLDQQSKSLTTYASNPLWQVVDGPWKLSGFSSDGRVTMVANSAYSGPDKATARTLKFIPYTSESAEYTALRAGNTITVGDVPLASAPHANAQGEPSKQPLGNYDLVVQQFPTIGYAYLDYHNATLAPLFKQLYIRQALESVVDQKVMIDKALNGYGTQVDGPVPLAPSTNRISSAEKSIPYSFSVAKARNYLTSNGWSIQASGPAVCTRPGTADGDCGAGIKGGQKLTIPVTYANEDPAGQLMIEQWAADASRAGINLPLTGETFPTWLGKNAGCQQSSAGCSWGVFFLYGQPPAQPYPTGEHAFTTGAAGNLGGYSDPKMDQLIEASTKSSSLSSLYTYEDYAAQQVPYIWMPTASGTVRAVAKNITGTTPFNINGSFEPQNWSFTK